MRTTKKYHPKSITSFKKQLLHWSATFTNVVWLDSNNYQQKYSNYDAILAVDAFSKITTNEENSFASLEAYQQQVNDWIFGYLTYDLKNDIEQLSSTNFDGIQFPALHFFQPKKIFLIRKNTVRIKYLKEFEAEIKKDIAAIEAIARAPKKEAKPAVTINMRISRDAYFKKFEKLQKNILRGTIYEANFCQEFYAENTTIAPLPTFVALNKISKAPFSVFLRLNDRYLLSASPERFLRKKGKKIISQPIKGTAKRSKNRATDKILKEKLKTDSKERSENIMIVDLVRNDLSKTAIPGSVVVKELCKVYTFKQVHQLISTIQSKVPKTISPVKIVQTTFPMGSMTGAPKIAAMQLIEAVEETKRGLYSGAVGYFSPKGNFDFNVVIRSILYHAATKYVSFSVGGAITAKSNAKKEYEECLLKAKAMREVLEKCL